MVLNKKMLTYKKASGSLFQPLHCDICSLSSILAVTNTRNELISCKNISLYYYFFLLLLFPSYNDAESCYRHLLCPVATSSGPYNGDYEFELFLLNDWLGLT